MPPLSKYLSPALQRSWLPRAMKCSCLDPPSLHKLPRPACPQPSSRDPPLYTSCPSPPSLCTRPLCDVQKKEPLTAISHAEHRLGSSDPGTPLRCTRGEIDGSYAGLLLSCWVFGVASTTHCWVGGEVVPLGVETPAQ
jgi:hypothetical protein